LLLLAHTLEYTGLGSAIAKTHYIIIIIIIKKQRL